MYESTIDNSDNAPLLCRGRDRISNCNDG